LVFATAFQKQTFCDAQHKGNFDHDAQAFELPPKKQA
jgi:hypothetical protein